MSFGATPNAACRPPRTPLAADVETAAPGSVAPDVTDGTTAPDLRAARAALMSSIELIEARSSALGMSAVKSDWVVERCRRTSGREGSGKRSSAPSLSYGQPFCESNRAAP